MNTGNFKYNPKARQRKYILLMYFGHLFCYIICVTDRSHLSYCIMQWQQDVLGMTQRHLHGYVTAHFIWVCVSCLSQRN